MEGEPLLKPMRPDALTRRRDTSCAPAPVSPGVQFLPEEPGDPAVLHKPEFAPFPVKKEVPPESDLDELLAATLPEEDEEEPAEDAVPTYLMPMPVCVPLYEEPQPRRRRSRRRSD